MDSSGVSKEQKVPRPLTLLMNWGYRACSGGDEAGSKPVAWVTASGCGSSDTPQGPAFGPLRGPAGVRGSGSGHRHPVLGSKPNSASFSHCDLGGVTWATCASVSSYIN